MSGLLDALNPIQAIGNLAKDLIGKFVQDPNQKAQLEAQLAEQQNAANQALLDASKETVLAEEKGDSWLQRSWRPIVGLGLFGVIFYAGVAVSIFNLPQINMAGVPPELWSTFKLCIGGYMGLRSIDKGVAAFAKNGSGSNGNGSS